MSAHPSARVFSRVPIHRLVHCPLVIFSLAFCPPVHLLTHPFISSIILPLVSFASSSAHYFLAGLFAHLSICSLIHSSAHPLVRSSICLLVHPSAASFVPSSIRLLTPLARFRLFRDWLFLFANTNARLPIRSSIHKGR